MCCDRLSTRRLAALGTALVHRHTTLLSQHRVSPSEVVRVKQPKKIILGKRGVNGRSGVGVLSCRTASRLTTILECGFWGGVTKVTSRYVERVFLTCVINYLFGGGDYVQYLLPVFISVLDVFETGENAGEGQGNHKH